MISLLEICFESRDEFKLAFLTVDLSRFLCWLNGQGLEEAVQLIIV